MGVLPYIGQCAAATAVVVGAAVGGTAVFMYRSKIFEREKACAHARTERERAASAHWMEAHAASQMEKEQLLRAKLDQRLISMDQQLRAKDEEIRIELASITVADLERFQSSQKDHYYKMCGKYGVSAVQSVQPAAGS
jgi:hypothetical protein